MHSGWMEKHRGGTERAKHRQYSACIRALRYIGRYLACACPMSAVSFISSTIRRLLPAYARPRVSRVPPSFHLSFSVSLIHIRYVRNLAVANSCTNVNAGSGRLYELFQFTSTNCGSFLRFLFFLPPPSFSFSCPFLVLSSFLLSFSSSRLRVRGHEPYRGNSTFVFVFRRRRWQNRKNRQDGRNGEREKCREVNEKVTNIFAVSINTRLIIESPRKEITCS